MIKIDYEKAWKELRDHNNEATFSLAAKMYALEQKYTQDVIELKRRSDKEMVDYCLKKNTEIYLELIELKNKLRELSK